MPWPPDFYPKPMECNYPCAKCGKAYSVLQRGDLCERCLSAQVAEEYAALTPEERGETTPEEVWMLYFQRLTEFTIKAESREAALAAAEKACDEGEVDGFCSYEDEWTVAVGSKPVLENRDANGIKAGRIVHISDMEEGENNEQV